MNLLAQIKQNLSEALQEHLASAAGTSLAATRQYAQVVLPALVEELARPVSPGDLNARWDMCRQLYLSQLLTEPQEWLRTDIGWPERRYYLAQSIVGDTRFIALTTGAALPPQAPVLLGYLTILALATIGQHASQANLAPAALGTWLGEQQVPAGSVPVAEVVSAPAPVVAKSTMAAAPARPVAPTAPAPAKPSAAPAAAPMLTTAPAKKQQTAVLSLVGVAVVAALAGGYFLLGNPANATEQQPAATAAEVTSPPAANTPAAAPAPTAAPAAAPASGVAAAPAAPVPTGPAVAAAKPVPVPSAKAGVAPAHVTGDVLIDTIGNAAQASHIGGSFDATLGRYPKGEGQPLDIKLINRATISVGINSSESLFYKRLVNSNLSRPGSIPLDRLAFEPNQAKLGAEGAQQLGSIASLLKTFPKARILVLGHATTKETEAMRLSLARANAVIDELVKQGIYAQRLQAQGVLATGIPAGANAAEKLAMQQGISLSVSRL